MNFHDLEWHDAIIKSIKVDRSDPELIDTIALEIHWPNDENNTVLFEGVDWANIDLHFYYLGPDYISDATVLERVDDEVACYLTKRQHLLDSKSDFYSIKSSVSEIRILAKSFRIMGK